MTDIRRSEETFPLVQYDAMRREIEAATTIDEVKRIQDQAVAIEVYVRRAKNWEAEKRVNEIKIWASRKIGELLSATTLNLGGGSSRSRSYVGTGGEEPPRTLPQVGITKNESSLFQKLAAIPEAEVEAALTRDRKRPPSVREIVNETSGNHARQNYQRRNDPPPFYDFCRQVEQRIDHVLSGDDEIGRDLQRIREALADVSRSWDHSVLDKICRDLELLCHRAERWRQILTNERGENNDTETQDTQPCRIGHR